MAKPNLGIRRVHSIELCVHEAGPWSDYLIDGFGFQSVGASTGEAAEKSGTRRSVFRCRDVSIVLSEKVHAGSPVHRYLGRHPEGICRVNFLVNDLAATEARLLERHATPTDFVKTEPVGEGEWSEFSIATPLGDVEYCFIECPDSAGLLMPGMEPAGRFDPNSNPLGLVGIDHLTSNTRTLMPAVAFCEHVLGFSRFWDVQFHTEDIRPGVGTGLKSIVMWDEESGIKLAHNEPLRPRFNESQVQVYVDANGGPGIHHVAFEVEDLIRAVDHARQRGIELLPTPNEYYDALPDRIKKRGIGAVSQPIEELKFRGILLDGDKHGYLLQAFCKDPAVQFKQAGAGPLLIEWVQRCGAKGFGEGNFRALFEAVSRSTQN